MLRPLTDADLAAARELLLRDPVEGGLIHSLLLRHGLAGEVLFWGLWQPGSEGGPVGETGGLEGIITVDHIGRLAAAGGGPEWGPAIAALLRKRHSEGLPSSSVVTPPTLAAAIAAQYPPRDVTPLEVWACHAPCFYGGDRLQAAIPGFAVRPVAAEDEAELRAIYSAQPNFSWLDVTGLMARVTAGDRFALVGEVGRRIAAVAWASLVEPHAARVSGVVTVPEQRGRGYGGRLLGELTGRLLEMGKTAYLYIDPGDFAALALYSRAGYSMHCLRVSLSY